MWAKLLTYLIEGGGFLAASRGLWFAYTWYVARRDRISTSRATESRSVIVRSLEDLVELKGIDYAQIIRVHNSGKDIAADVPLFMTCLYEVRATGLQRLRSKIQRLSVDESYHPLLARIVSEKDAAGPVTDLDDVALDSIYNAMGARWARVVLLKTTRKGIFFLRLASQTEELDAEKYALPVRVAVSTISIHLKN